MYRTLTVLCAMAVAGSAIAQESEVTQVTTTTTMSGSTDLIGGLWFVDDATVLDTGAVDLRFTFGFQTGGEPFNNGDADDDFVLTPSLYWGAAENLEVFASVPIWMGDGGDAGALDEGNADTNVGFTWRIADPVDGMHAMALKSSFRFPTGDSSNGIDFEERLILTNEYASGIRSHFNIYGKTVNSDNWKSAGGSGSFGSSDNFDDRDSFRHFQWGVVLGMDGPLCSDGAVRWVLDYVNRTSTHYGRSNVNMLETGWEWAMSDSENLGMSLQFGLDHAGDAPNFGATIAYTHALTY